MHTQSRTHTHIHTHTCTYVHMHTHKHTQVIVTSAQRTHGSLTDVQSFDAPRTSSLHLSNSPREGTTQLKIFGSMFAPRDFTLKASLGGECVGICACVCLRAKALVTHLAICRLLSPSIPALRLLLSHLSLSTSICWVVSITSDTLCLHNLFD